MMSWIRQFLDSSRETKYFILNWALYLSVLIGTAIYCYARLDFVRSFDKAAQSHHTQATNTK